MKRLIQHLSYANVTASVALFVALGGTGYAVTQLPRNSVSSPQIKRGAVGASELRARAVRSRHIRDRSVALSDISVAARTALRGAAGPAGPQGAKGDPGPPGVTFSAAIDSGCGRARGNSVTCTGPGGEATYRLTWERDVSQCQAAATLAKVPGGLVEDPPAGRITVRPEGTGVAVRTFDENGQPASLPFNVIVAC